MTFPEARNFLTGGPINSGKSRPACPRPSANDPAHPSGLPEAEALALVEGATARLWATEGADALAYLHGRGLTDETIRAARLGWTPWVTIPKADGSGFRALGWLIPWFASGRLTLLKIRQPDDRRPKYVEAFRDPTRLVCYPGPEVIRTGRPLVIPEGELDALLLSQELSSLDVSVVTLGSASTRPAADILGRMSFAPVWHVATDADEAAAGWPDCARRVRPPLLWPHPADGTRKAKTDWTDLHLFGVNLRRWWSDRLGEETSPLFSWDELALRRLGTGRRRSSTRNRH